MIKTLRQPFPRPDRNVFQRILHSFFEGLGVALFFLIFQPFGMSVWKIENKVYYLIAYGAIVFVVTAFYRLLLPALFPRYFEEKNWVVWKEIVSVIFILGLISILIVSYHHVVFKEYNNYFKRGGVIFFLVTVIGSIPVTVSVLSRFAYLYRKYNKEVQVIRNFNGGQTKKLMLRAENEKDTLNIDDLLFIESADNYCSVVFLEEGKERKELIRSSLTRLEAQITEKGITRCHRSFIVNLGRVKVVKGNAQGYKLHLEGTGEIIPVSRKYAFLIGAIYP